MIPYRRAALIGTGHIGGSLVAALRRAGLVERVVGFDRDAARAARALGLGLIDEAAGSAAQAARGADLVVLGTPVGATADVARSIAGAVADARLVIDVGSTKAAVVAAVEALLPGAPFIGAHPIAGTERSGPDAADAALFRDRPAILTPTPRTPPAVLDEARALWESVGAWVRVLVADEHDALFALLSHLPHVAAFALAATADAALDRDARLRPQGLAGGGFRDTTRVAASDVTMWRDILLGNRAAVLPLVDELSAQLGALRAAIDEGDRAALDALLARGNRGRRRVLDAPPAVPPDPQDTP